VSICGLFSKPQRNKINLNKEFWLVLDAKSRSDVHNIIHFSSFIKFILFMKISDIGVIYKRNPYIFEDFESASQEAEQRRKIK
jgi:hypothetical protein